MKITAHRDAGMDRAKHRADMREEKIWPPDVSRVGDAVLGHKNGKTLPLEGTQHSVEPLGVQLPVQVRSRRPNRKHSFTKELGAVVTVEFHQLSGVVVQPEEILARSRPAGVAGARERERQPALPERLQESVIENPIERRGHNPVLRRE